MNIYFLTTLVFVALLGGLSTFLWVFLDDSRKENLLLLNKYKPYKKKERLMSPNENKLFTVLTSLPSLNNFQIFPQVPYSAIINVDPELYDLEGHFYIINSYRSDFVICDKENSTPLVVIELNDASHFYSHRKARDRFVQSALRTAKIPFVILKTKDLMDKDYIENCIFHELSKNENRQTN